MMQKGFSLPLIIIGVAVLITVTGAGVYYLGTKRSETFEERLARLNPTVSFTNPPSPTNPPDLSSLPEKSVMDISSWKTYTSDKYKYSLKYQPNSRLKQFGCSMVESLQKGEEVFVLDEVDSTFPECGFGGYVWPISISVEDAIVDCKSDDLYTATQTQIVVGGVNTIRCDYEFTGDIDQRGPGPEDMSNVFVPKDGQYFLISLSNKKYSKTFDQILSTFKFTN